MSDSTKPKFKITDLDHEDKVFIVFKGIPEVVYVGDGSRAYDTARERALALAEDTNRDTTFMLVPKECVDTLSMVVHNHGFMIHALQYAKKANWPDPEDY